jgi:hypothetical protein
LNDETRTFCVTHPFHPLFGRDFVIATRHHTWADDRVFFYDDGQQLQSLPTAWTSLAPADPFVLVSAGRAAFRLQDLLELARLVRRLLAPGSPE